MSKFSVYKLLAYTN